MKRKPQPIADEIPTDDTQPGIGAVDDDDDDGADGDPLLVRRETPVRGPRKPRPKREG